MKKTFLLFLLLAVTTTIYSQKDTKTLVSIDGKKITVKEFKEVYEKNLSLLEDSGEKELEKNLDLFINYRLKVKEAYQLKLDTLKSYQREIASYKNQLYAPYLKDQDVLDSITRQAYERSKLEIKGSHILVRLAKDANPKDTLKAFEKITNARNRILKGESFEKVAKELSEDRSVLKNGGDLGYFSAFKMVKEFEDAGFSTKKGEVSMPFKTRFGYHIIKVFDKRPSQGERKVAHILITGDKKKGKEKIDSVYKVIQEGAKFEDIAKKVSNDTSSKRKGGVLPRFGSGRMIPAFEKVAFSLENKEDVSKPFQTRFGWHIIKLLDVYPILSYEKSEEELKQKLKKSGRYSLSRKAMIQKLKRKYTIKENETAKSFFTNKQIRSFGKDSTQAMLFSINDKVYKQSDFVSYLKNRRHRSVAQLYSMFFDEKVLDFYKENLVNEEPKFAKTLKEYEEGLLLFELMQKKVWEKSTDSLSLANFYKLKKNNYKEPLDKIKGKVINDYQKDIENKWVADLRRKSVIEVDKRQFKKLKKAYAKKDSK